MGLKRHTKYQWKLFFPGVIIIWLIIAMMGIWMYRNERKLRIEGLQNQIEFINSRIVESYNANENPESFYRFISKYYINHPLYDQIRVTTYYNGKLRTHVGAPILPADTRRFIDGKLNLEENVDTDESRRKANLYYDVQYSDDRRLAVYTMLPFDDQVIKATSVSNSLFYLLIALAVLGTILTYITTRRLGRNIRFLRDFAERATNDLNFVPSDHFSHDELGDISRHIVNFYNERNRTILKIQREHHIAIHALEEKNRLKRELTNNVNHELKTPISVIKGYLDTINENPDMDDASRRHFLLKVSEHVDRLTQLVNDISNITRLEYGSQMINTEPINFHEIVFQCVSEFETSGMLGNMIFNYDIPTYCRVIGNASLLTAVINNLTKNAVAYSKGTEINLILTDKDDTFFHFAFYDNGAGVKEESIPHLFERFFREDNGRSRKKGGTGLGLPIVQNTIEALGGNITVANRKGGGLIFRFTLCRVKEQDNHTD